MNNIFHLVYISEAVADISYTDIRDILSMGREQNGKVDVTSLLIFRDGYFVQLLEGDETNVRKILSSILLDERNYSLRILSEARSEQRLFGRIPLAFYDGDISANSTPDLENLFDFCTSKNGQPKDQILPLFQKFISSINLNIEDQSLI